MAKHKSLGFVNLSLFLHHVSILEHLYILSKRKRPVLVLKVQIYVLWCKSGIYSWNLSHKSSLDVWRFISNSTSLQFEVYQPLFYSSKILRYKRDFNVDDPCFQTIFQLLMTMLPPKVLES